MDTKTPVSTVKITTTEHPNLFLQAFAVTCFSLVLLFLFNNTAGRVFEKFERIFPNSNKIEDFELSDMCFAYRDEYATQDTNIIIVNTSKDDRLSLAHKISKVSSLKPVAIGIDIIFSGNDTTRKTDSLVKTVNAVNTVQNNIVLAVGGTDNNLGRSTDLDFYQRLQRLHGNAPYQWGFLKQEEESSTLRTFEPYFENKGGGHVDTAFEIKLMQIAFGTGRVNSLDREREKWTVINYRRPFQGGTRYRVYESIPENERVFSGKIVLFGLLDSTLIEDRHFTPLNGALSKSRADMFGVEIHAQVLSMLINRDFVNPMRFQASLVFMACYLCTALFIFIHRWRPLLYHYINDSILVLIITPVTLFVSYCLLRYKSIKLEPVAFIIPIFACGFLLHFYEWFVKRRVIRKYGHVLKHRVFSSRRPQQKLLHE